MENFWNFKFVDLITAIVGFLALIIYFLQKNQSIIISARIIKSEILSIEKLINEIKAIQGIDRRIPRNISSLSWESHKQHFTNLLTSEELSSVEKFFNEAKELLKARDRMFDIFHEGLIAKAGLVQEALVKARMDAIENRTSPEELNAKRIEIINSIDEESHVFEPIEPKTMINISLIKLSEISNTPAFSKISMKAQQGPFSLF